MENIIQNAAARQTEARPAEMSRTTQINQFIKKMAPQIQEALPAVITPERFTRMMLTAVRNTPKLAECSVVSLCAAMMNAAQLGVEPNTTLGQAYLIPYKNKGKDEVQFQLGYKGMIDLAYRSGEVEVVQAHIVYENDTFVFEYGLTPQLRHVPAAGERGNPVYVYAMFRTKSGGFGFEVMSMEDVREHAKKYSKSYSSGYSPWQTNFEEMAKKTVLKKCLKYAPLKSDTMRGIASDGTIKTELAADMSEVVSEPIEVIPTTAVDSITGEVLHAE